MILILLLIFLDRNNIILVVFTIALLFVLSGIAILRAFESRNEWRKIIKEESLDKDIP